MELSVRFLWQVVALLKEEPAYFGEIERFLPLFRYLRGIGPFNSSRALQVLLLHLENQVPLEALLEDEKISLSLTPNEILETLKYFYVRYLVLKAKDSLEKWRENGTLKDLETLLGNIFEEIERVSHRDTIDFSLNWEEALQQQEIEIKEIPFWLPNLFPSFLSNRLYLVAGLAKTGKSFFLLQSFLHAGLQGVPSILITLENDILETIHRILSYLVGKPQWEVSRMGLEEKKAHLQKLKGLPLRIVHFSSLSVPALKSYLRTLPFRPEFVIVDYLDLLTPTTRRQSLREELRSITVSLKHLSTEMNVAVLTATQINREGEKADRIGLEHIAEDWSKVMFADVVLTLDINRETRRGHISISAGRNLPSGRKVPVFADFDRARFVESSPSSVTLAQMVRIDE